MIDQQEMGADEEGDDNMDESEETFVDADARAGLGMRSMSEL